LGVQDKPKYDTDRKCVKTQLVTVRGKVHVLECWGKKQEGSSMRKYRIKNVCKIRVNASVKYTEDTKYCVKCYMTFRNVLRSHMITFSNSMKCKENLDFTNKSKIIFNLLM
jgi:hypothetical protein